MTALPIEYAPARYAPASAAPREPGADREPGGRQPACAPDGRGRRQEPAVASPPARPPGYRPETDQRALGRATLVGSSRRRTACPAWSPPRRGQTETRLAARAPGARDLPTPTETPPVAQHQVGAVSLACGSGRRATCRRRRCRRRCPESDHLAVRGHERRRHSITRFAVVYPTSFVGYTGLDQFVAPSTAAPPQGADVHRDLGETPGSPAWPAPTGIQRASR
ncbi:hypothetical protein DSL92_03520 [Billgrantia gudaonensis]|uniref:Uncharacterized protein n=1 Tax=Billgrantia gudaonensis TaxID=376427 RepID=A0A432JKJ0_9GAMM|nr:hypothetical protein DSL92_03520 [Halomonas gudaonensis]